jgi:hypothetical protein
LKGDADGRNAACQAAQVFLTTGKIFPEKRGSIGFIKVESQDGIGVDTAAVDPEGPVEVGACDSSRCSDFPDHIPFGNKIPSFYIQF